MRKRIVGFCDQRGVEWWVGKKGTINRNDKVKGVDKAESEISWISWSGRTGEPIEVGMHGQPVRFEVPYNTVTWIAYESEKSVEELD